MSTQYPESLKAEVEKQRWFHAIDFGGFSSSGRFRKGHPQNITLYGAFEFLQSMNLSGASVLDVGTVDGLVAFGVARLGAHKIVATDTHDRPTFHLARKTLTLEDHNISYLPRVQVRDLPLKFPEKTFDVIVCAGVFYHMLHPVQAFSDCRKVLKDGGYLILETPFDSETEEAVLRFNGTSHFLNEPNSYFIPTESALCGLAALTGFKVCAVRVLDAPRRITLLLQAVTREELTNSSSVAPFIKQMLKRDLCDDSFRHADIEKNPSQACAVDGRLAELPARRLIKADTEHVTFPYHSRTQTPGLGQTAWEEVSGNTRVL